MKKKLMSMTLAAGMIAALIAPSAAFAAQSVGRVYDLEAEREGAYVELEWDEVYGSDGYQILRSDSKNGTYASIKFLKGEDNDEYLDKTTSKNKTYYYKVRAYENTKSGKTYGAYSSVVSVKAVSSSSVGQVKDLEVERKGSYVELEWDDVKGAGGYQIYRSTSKNGSYSLIKTIKGQSCDEYLDKSASKNKTYYYKVRAYKTVSGSKKYGSFSNIVTVKPVGTLGKVNDLEAEREGRKHIELEWDDVNGASGYQIYRSTSKNGSYSLIKTIKGQSYDEYHDKSSSLVSGKRYYYKVRAYKTVGNSKTYGAFSSIVSAKA